MELKSVLRMRQSCREYKEGPVPAKVLSEILDAAQMSPVGMGRFDMMHMKVITDKKVLEHLGHNAAAFMNRKDDPIYGAPVVILVSASMPEPHMVPMVYMNAGCMIENMMLAATDVGLGSCYLLGAIAALNTNPELVAALKLPEEKKPLAAVAIGYPKAPLQIRPIGEYKICVE